MSDGGIKQYRLQSAMEYLLQYGWAILIIAIIFVALYALGILNADNFAPKISPGACQVITNVEGTSLQGQCNNELPEYTAVFDGKTGYISTPYVQSGVTSYTIAAWVETTASQGVIVQDRGGGAGKSLTLAIGPSCGESGSYCSGSSAGVPAIGVDSNGVWIGLNANKKINNGAWHFIVGTFNDPSGNAVRSSDFEIYIDGVPAAGNAGAIGAVSSPLTGLGGTVIAYHQAWNYHYTGSLADIQIYNTSLSASDVKALYVEGIGAVPIYPENIEAWWPLNGNANDYSGHSQSGTIAGGVSFIGSWWQQYTNP